VICLCTSPLRPCKDDVPHRLPPHVDHRGQAGELLADFVEHLLFDRQPMGLQQLLECGDLGRQLRFPLLWACFPSLAPISANVWRSASLS
jgi:hypothetical protein